MSSDNPPELSNPPPVSAGSLDVADIRRQVEHEQALFDARRKVAALEAEVEKVKKDKEAAERGKEEISSVVNQLRTQLSSLQSSHHETTSSLSVLQTRWQTSEREKLELLEETTKLQERTKKANEELYILRTQKTEASQKIAHLDVEVSELKMRESTSKFNEERSVAALQNARNEILNLGKAIADVEERFGKYRVDKQSEIQQIQVEHDSLKSRLTSSEHSHRSLQQTFDAQSRRLADAHANIATLTSAAASQKASFRLELNRLTEEIRLLEKRADDSRAAIADREAELERLVEHQSEKEKTWEERWKKEERNRKEAEKRSEDLKIVVERLAMANGEGASISAAASVASGMKQSGKTYTEFYRDYVIQEGKLRASEIEVNNLQQLLDEITQDIEERKYDLESQAAEKDRAVERANSLAAELAAVLTARDGFESRVRALVAENSNFTDEMTELRSTTADLSRQVQSLLRQIAIKDDPSLANVALDSSVSIKEGDIITDKLLEFKSIRQLQEQNQRLIKVSRGLSARLDEREIRRAAANGDDLDTGATLDQATETITKLHTQLLEAQKKINEAHRERDFFSKLLARGDGLKLGQTVSGNGTVEDGDGIHHQSITTLQAELDIVKREMDVEISKAKEQVAAKDQAVGVAEVEKAKAEAKIAVLEEQQRILNDSNSLQKQEYTNLEKVYRDSRSTISQTQLELRMARQEAETHRAAADRARNEAANLRAEKEQWKSHESRLESNLRAVNEERAKLQHLIDNLQTIGREGEQTRAEEIKRWEQREENLKKDCMALRSEVEKAREATRAAEKRVEEFDSRLESATAAVRAEKEAAEALASTRQQELEKITKQSEERRAIGLNWKKRADSLNEEKANWQKQLADEIEGRKKTVEDLNARIQTLSKELEEVKGKVVEAEKRVVEAEKTIQAKDQLVQKLEVEAEASASSATGTVDSASLTVIQSERDDLRKQLEQARKDIDTAKASAETSATSGNAEGQAVTDEERAKWEAERASEKAIQDKRYEEGVLRVNRANTNLKSRVENLLAEKQTLDAQLSELRSELEALRKAQTQTPSTSTAEAGEITVPPSQEVINEAVQTAIASREAELKAEYEAALQAAKSAAASTTASSNEKAIDEAAIQAAVTEKEKELKQAFAKQLAEAVASAKSAAPVAAAESDPAAAVQAKAQIEELEKKIKTLERQARTTEISRKTLERRTTEAEAKASRLEAAAHGNAPLTTPTTLTTASSAVTPVIPTTAAAKVEVRTPAQAGPSSQATGTTPAAPPATVATTTPSGTPIRGARGGARGRGLVRGGPATRGVPNARNSILSTVNAQLASTTDATTTTTTSPTGTKRPLPEDETGGGEVQSDILARIQNASGGDAAGAARGRLIKRPRGAGPVRGRGGARRTSATGPDGGDPGASNDSAAGNGSGTSGNSAAGGTGGPAPST